MEKIRVIEAEPKRRRWMEYNMERMVEEVAKELPGTASLKKRKLLGKSILDSTISDVLFTRGIIASYVLHPTGFILIEPTHHTDPADPNYGSYAPAGDYDTEDWDADLATLRN
jgi:hypothetical protein